MFGMNQGKGSAQVEHAACGCPVCPQAFSLGNWTAGIRDRCSWLSSQGGSNGQSEGCHTYKGMAARAQRSRGSLGPDYLHSPPQDEVSKLQEQLPAPRSRFWCLQAAI